MLKFYSVWFLAAQNIKNKSGNSLDAAKIQFHEISGYPHYQTSIWISLRISAICFFVISGCLDSQKSIRKLCTHAKILFHVFSGYPDYIKRQSGLSLDMVKI